MSALAILVTICCALGFITMFCSVVVTNYAVQKMRGVLNERRGPQDQLGWSDAVQKVAQRVIDEYREQYPEGPLNRTLRVGYYMLGIGLVVGLGSVFLLKFVD
jgi:hypothetical protein